MAFEVGKAVEPCYISSARLGGRLHRARENESTCARRHQRQRIRRSADLSGSGKGPGRSGASLGAAGRASVDQSGNQDGSRHCDLHGRAGRELGDTKARALLRNGQIDPNLKNQWPQAPLALAAQGGGGGGATARRGRATSGPEIVAVQCSQGAGFCIQRLCSEGDPEQN